MRKSTSKMCPWSLQTRQEVGIREFSGVEKSFPDLSASYRRTIGTTLRFLDKMICAFEDLAKGREVHSVLYSESNHLSTVQRKVLLAEIAEIRRLLAGIKEVLGLDGSVQGAAEFIWSQCSGLWASLSETESKRLKGYGKAPSGFSEYWDPKLSELSEHLNAILETLKTD